MTNPSETYPLNPKARSSTYIHRKRKTRYKKVGYHEYADASPAYDNDEMLMVEAGDDTVIICANSPDLQIRCKIGQKMRYKGKLQCTIPVMFGSILIMYIDIDSKKIWFRPKQEFEDGRFEEVPYVG